MRSYRISASFQKYDYQNKEINAFKNMINNSHFIDLRPTRKAKYTMGSIDQLNYANPEMIKTREFSYLTVHQRLGFKTKNASQE